MSHSVVWLRLLLFKSGLEICAKSSGNVSPGSGQCGVTASWGCFVVSLTGTCSASLYSPGTSALSSGRSPVDELLRFSRMSSWGSASCLHCTDVMRSCAATSPSQFVIELFGVLHCFSCDLAAPSLRSRSLNRSQLFVAGVCEAFALPKHSQLVDLQMLAPVCLQWTSGSSSEWPMRACKRRTMSAERFRAFNRCDEL